MVLSASSVASLTDYGSPWYFFLRQLMWTALGAGRVRGRDPLRLPPAGGGSSRPLLILSAVLLVVVLVPGVGIYVVGLAALARRRASFRFQPSELAKLALLLYAADLVSRRARRARRLAPGRAAGRRSCSAGFALLVMKEPDLGSAHRARAHRRDGARRRRRPAAPPRGGGARSASPSVTLLALAEPYRRARMLTFLHPFADSTNAGYQISQSLIALGSGGLTGVGLGAGRAKWNFLPNAHTDFIFAIIGEELGLHRLLPRDRAVHRVRACSASAPRCARPTGSARCSPPGSRCGSSGRR